MAYDMSIQPPQMLHRKTDALYMDAENSVTAGAGGKSTAPTAMNKGQLAVRMSKMSREMKEKDSEGLEDSEYVKRIGDRTFYLKNDFWIDGEYKDEKTIDIKYSSPAYMDLILTYPEIAKFAALGEKVIFKLKDNFIKISEQGKENLSQQELRKMFK